MRIKLKELSFDFTNDEIIDFLIKNGYKIEEHKVKSFLDDKYFGLQTVASYSAMPFTTELVFNYVYHCTKNHK